MPHQDDYQVTLEAFCGPMDLLLYLIRRAEVDIHDIPVAAITDQYLAFLGQVEEIDVELAGEFLVMAATLIELKSRTLVPPSAEDDQQDEDGEQALDVSDPRYELVQQLLAYQRYRLASEDLTDKRTEFSLRYPRRPGSRASSSPPEYEPLELELEDVHVLDLSGAYERLMSSIDVGKLGDHRVEMDETPIEVHQDELLEKLTDIPQHRITLQEAFADGHMSERIGVFLAMLELVRLRKITVRQDEIDGEISIVLNVDPEENSL